jgi:hypothetical protein
LSITARFVHRLGATHACCDAVSKVCCDVSAPRGACSSSHLRHCYQSKPDVGVGAPFHRPSARVRVPWSFGGPRACAAAMFFPPRFGTPLVEWTFVTPAVSKFFTEDYVGRRGLRFTRYVSICGPHRINSSDVPRGGPGDSRTAWRSLLRGRRRSLWCRCRCFCGAAHCIP